MAHRKAVILLSRQSLRPNSRTDWIQNTVRAVKWICDHNLVLITSIGMQTWELLTALAVEFNLEQEVHIPSFDERAFLQSKKWIIEQFSPDENRIRFIPVFPTNGDKKKDMPIHRDRATVDTADIVIPISVRPKGNMEQLVNEAVVADKTVVSTFSTTYRSRTDKLKYEIVNHSLNPELDKIDSKYLIHWTRSSNGAWPDECQIDYWRAVIYSEEYPRGGFDTLKHILTTESIIASSRHMPNKIASVSFSGLSPSKALKLMRWRARYREMSFEPYGIGIDRDYALKYGVAAVLYSNSGIQKQHDVDMWRRQSRGRKTDWSSEEEYRYRDDINLSKIPTDKLLAFCYRPDEADSLKSTNGIRIISILA